MLAFAPDTATPYNLLIEVRTMRIVYRVYGGFNSSIRSKIAEYFQTH